MSRISRIDVAGKGEVERKDGERGEERRGEGRRERERGGGDESCASYNVRTKITK